MRYHLFISHMQAEASGEVGLLYHKLEGMGVHCWRDMNATDLTTGGMRQGVLDSEVFLLLLSSSVLSRAFCLKEIGWAIEFKKHVV